MRDYRYVKVPPRERAARKRGAVKRVSVGADGRRRGPSPGTSLLGTLALVLLALLGWCGWTGYRWLTSPATFPVAGVDVQGVRMVGDAEARQLAALFTGQNIFQVDLEAAALRARENPWVKEVVVERNLPDRIRIAITERVPRAVLQAANGRFLVDREGMVIAPVPAGSGAGLPAVTLREWRAAVRTPAPRAAIEPAMELLDELASRGGWDIGQVSIRAESRETIAVLYAGREFRVGSGNYGEKLRRIGEIVSDMNKNGHDYAYVDVRPDRQAAVMIKAPGRGPARKKRA